MQPTFGDGLADAGFDEELGRREVLGHRLLG